MERHIWIEKFLTGKECEISDIKEFFRLEGMDSPVRKCPKCGQVVSFGKIGISTYKIKNEDNTLLEISVNGYTYLVSFEPIEDDQVRVVDVTLKQGE